MPKWLILGQLVPEPLQVLIQKSHDFGKFFNLFKPQFPFLQEKNIGELVSKPLQLEIL